MKDSANAPDINPSIELVEKLVHLLEDSNATGNTASGACVYNTPTGPKCAQLTPDQCAVLGGTYVGGKC